MHSKMVFNKPPLSIPEQIHHLRQKGLLLDNEQEASHYLTVIGYYRLMIYFKPFLINSEAGIRQFKPNTRFSDLLNLYVFDRELRLLVTDALERIEVSFRTAISNAMSLKYGAHWYLCADLFSSIEQHHMFLEEVKSHLKRSHEDFIKTYYAKYHQPEHPPSWMVMECISFGTVSKLYANIKDRTVRKEIGDTLGQYSEIIKSWMRSLTYTRNLCAHHSRLWNRFFVNKPKVPEIRVPFDHNESPFYLQAYIIHSLLKNSAPDNHWREKLLHLFKNNPSIPFINMGFSEDWEQDGLWVLE